ncbi:MAG: prephenate dehydrogenase/arogenate dehydrogenase family protein, partial [Lachnospiraceae bacterium]|nr:prephenate dehydrogenase/arogenate dehydrogenase family protein [Lachnospiraceae bacterium]
MANYGFIGLGLIGGSIAKKLRRIEPNAKIYVCTRNNDAKEAALEDGVLDGVFTTDGAFRAGTTSAGGALGAAPYSVTLDVLFLCAPVEANLELLELVAKWAPAQTTITDVGSVKGPILKLAKKLKLKNFVPGHPMMGTEFSGYAASKEELLKGSVYLLAPLSQTEPSHVHKLKLLLEQ